MFPLHVLLLICDRIPPNVEESVRPVAAPHEEGSQVEAGAILCHDHVDRVGLAISNRASRDLIQIMMGERMRYVARVEVVDVALDFCLQVVEDVVLK